MMRASVRYMDAERKAGAMVMVTMYLSDIRNKGAHAKEWFRQGCAKGRRS